jgi:plastocyanin
MEITVKPIIIIAAALCWSAPALAGEISIDQTNGQFSQTTETLSKGDDLLLVNKDSGPHDINVVDADGDPTDLGVQAPGATVKIKFSDPGIYKLRCAIAPSMHMSVTVN